MAATAGVARPNSILGVLIIKNQTFADFCRACSDVSHLANEMDAQAVLITRGPLLPLSNIVRVKVTATTPRGRRPYAQMRRATRVVKRRPYSK